MAERSYIVGLPVAVTVSDDGKVHLAVDTAEASSALWDDQGTEGEQIPEDQVRADQARVDKAREDGSLTTGVMWSPDDD